MMSSTPRAADPRRRAGFTLTEMLVVIGIIVLVLGIAMPMVTNAWKKGDRLRTASDLQAIAAALEAYRQDHGDYPPVPQGALFTGCPTDYNGARILCRALIAPGPASVTSPTPTADAADGADGPGFRTRGTSGRVYGPYLPADKFKLADPSGTGQTKAGYLAIMDRYNKPILYYPANGKPNIRLPKAYAWDRTATDRPMYNALDNWSGTVGAMPKETLSRMLGDTNGNGQIDDNATPPETPAYDGPFLLWSAGPDEVFGAPQGIVMNNPANTIKGVQKSDDITNFTR